MINISGLTSSKLKWLSVWCRQYSVNFGDVMFDTVEQKDIEGVVEDSVAKEEEPMAEADSEAEAEGDGEAEDISEEAVTKAEEVEIEPTPMAESVDQMMNDMADTVDQLITEADAQPGTESEEDSKSVIETRMNEEMSFSSYKYPPNCLIDECTYMADLKIIGEDMEVQVMSKVGTDMWTGVAFSEDPSMVYS